MIYVRIDGVAHAIARAHTPSLPNPVQTTGRDPACATVHGTPQQERDFAHRVRALDRSLADCLARAVAQTGAGADVPRYVAELCTPLSALDVRRVTGIGFAYELHRQAALKRQRLTADVQDAAEDDPLLRHHHLSITVTVPRDFVAQARDALAQAIDAERLWATEEDRAELLDIIQDQVDVVRRKRAVPPQSWPVHIGVLPGVLERDRRTIFATGSLFRADLFREQARARYPSS